MTVTKQKKPAKSVRDYLGVNSVYERPDGTKMSHEEAFTTIVNAIGLKTCICYIPATKEEIRRALKTDENLNNIPLKKWDGMHAKHAFIPEFTRIGINSISMSDTVCTLKRAARMWAAQEDDE